MGSATHRSLVFKMLRSPVLLACGLTGITLIIGGILDKKLDPPPPPPVSAPAQQQVARAAPTPVMATGQPNTIPVRQPSSVANDLQQQQQPTRRAGTVELRASNNGHFMAPVEINGRSFNMMVDTGASVVTLSHEDARKAMLVVPPTEYKVPANTAGGVVKVALVKLNRVSIGPIVVRDLQASVLPAGINAPSLLGMNFLRALSSYEVKDNKMIMRN